MENNIFDLEGCTECGASKATVKFLPTNLSSDHNKKYIY